MGATASTNIATNFFEASRNDGCPSIQLELNQKTSKRVADEGVKLMPGGALVEATVECPSHQIGDGKGVAGKLRIVDSGVTSPAESSKLFTFDRNVDYKSQTQQVKPAASLGDCPVLKPQAVKTTTEPCSHVQKETNRASAHIAQPFITSPLDQTSKSNVLPVSGECPMSQASLLNQNEASLASQALAGQSQRNSTGPVGRHKTSPAVNQADQQVVNQSDSLGMSPVVPSLINQTNRPWKGQSSLLQSSYPSECPMSCKDGEAKAVSDEVNKDNMVTVILILL